MAIIEKSYCFQTRVVLQGIYQYILYIYCKISGCVYMYIFTHLYIYTYYKSISPRVYPSLIGSQMVDPHPKAFGISLRPDGHGGLGVYVPWDSSGCQRGSPYYHCVQSQVQIYCKYRPQMMMKMIDYGEMSHDIFVFGFMLLMLLFTWLISAPFEVSQCVLFD